MFWGDELNAINHSTAIDTSASKRETIAMKKINGITESLRDCKRALREIKIMKHLNHENVGSKGLW